MKAVITVVGRDRVGIIALVSTECQKYGVNIVDISQTVMREYFTMIMLAEIDRLEKDGKTVAFSDFAEEMANVGKEHGLDIRVMHEDIVNTMHRI